MNAPTAVLIFSCFVISGCSTPESDCFSRLGDQHPNLSFDQSAGGLKQDGETLKGMVRVREIGAKKYFSKTVSCTLEGGEVKAASCPGCG